MITDCQAIPSSWPQLDEARGAGGLSIDAHTLQSHPNGGWDAIIARGVQQYYAREGSPPLGGRFVTLRHASSCLRAFTKDQEEDLSTSKLVDGPNTLSALLITIRPERRSLGLAERMINAMKQAAREDGLQILVTPLRPTRKSEFSFVLIGKYINWTQKQTSPSNLLSLFLLKVINNSLDRFQNDEKLGNLPFDPWLRKHVGLGSKVVKVAPSSMSIRGRLATWQAWTGIDLQGLLLRIPPDNLKREPESNLEYVDVPFQGGLVPLRIHVKDKTCNYTEPNVWLYHGI